MMHVNYILIYFTVQHVLEHYCSAGFNKVKNFDDNIISNFLCYEARSV